eukprot:1190110-Prorocentrum_minimum.AAC.2
MAKHTTTAAVIIWRPRAVITCRGGARRGEREGGCALIRWRDMLMMKMSMTQTLMTQTLMTQTVMRNIDDESRGHAVREAVEGHCRR